MAVSQEFALLPLAAGIGLEALRMQADPIALSAGRRSTPERVVPGSVSLPMATPASCDMRLVRKPA